MGTGCVCVSGFEKKRIFGKRRGCAGWCSVVELFEGVQEKSVFSKVGKKWHCKLLNILCRTEEAAPYFYETHHFLWFP